MSVISWSFRDVCTSFLSYIDAPHHSHTLHLMAVCAPMLGMFLWLQHVERDLEMEWAKRECESLKEADVNAIELNIENSSELIYQTLTGHIIHWNMACWINDLCCWFIPRSAGVSISSQTNILPCFYFCILWGAQWTMDWPCPDQTWSMTRTTDLVSWSLC